MASRETADAGEMAARRGRQLAALVRHAIDQSPAFAKRGRRAGLDGRSVIGLGELARLPPLTRSEITGAGKSFFCRQWPRAHGDYSTISTSGSTGEPLRARRTALCQTIWLANTLREHLWHGRDFRQRFMAIRNSVDSRRLSAGWGKPAGLFFETGAALALPVTISVEEACREMLDFRPGYLLGPPSTIAGMLQWFEDHKERPAGLESVRAFSETVTDGLRDRIAAVLGVPVNDLYSSQELGVIAIECPQSGLLHTVDSLIVEVLAEDGRPCGSGETGRIVVTDLANHATPLIRYEIGDYAEVGPACSCGRTLPTLKRILGRYRNLVVYPDGSRHWPKVGFTRFAEVIPVRQFQFIQKSRTALEAHLVVESHADAEQEERLRAIIRAAIGYPFDVDFVYHSDSIPRGPGGKFEEFVSQVA